MSGAGTAIGTIVAVLAVAAVVVALVQSVWIVKEKEAVVIERLGRFKDLLTPGVHLIVPFIDRAKRYSFRYYVTDARNNVQLVTKNKESRISTQNEVLDFPRQAVITRDNAMIWLDAVLQFRIVNPQTTMYSSQNLPNMLSKILQAQIRNVAGTLDVDQIIEDNAALDRVSGEIDVIARKWGIRVELVKIQRVEAGELAGVLAQKKNADLKNKEVIINAKSNKQTRVIESEGHRDRMTREAEGEMAQTLSRARGQAQSIINSARAEARSVKEIARAVADHNENPAKYLLALKYIEALQQIVQQPSTKVEVVPHEMAFLQTSHALGLNTVMPRRV